MQVEDRQLDRGNKYKLKNRDVQQDHKATASPISRRQELKNQYFGVVLWVQLLTGVVDCEWGCIGWYVAFYVIY